MLTRKSNRKRQSKKANSAITKNGFFRAYSEWMLIFSLGAIGYAIFGKSASYSTVQLSEYAFLLLASLIGFIEKAGKKEFTAAGCLYIFASGCSLFFSLLKNGSVSINIAFYVIGATLCLVKLHRESTNNAEQEIPANKEGVTPSTTYSDELLPAAMDIVLETGQASVSMLQRRLQLGYSRAARLVDEMESHGYVGPFEGSRPRQILINRGQWQELRKTIHFAPKNQESISPPKQNSPSLNMEQVLRDEENWRRARLGLSPIEYELRKIDAMEGHVFEEWCADLLRKNGFHSVKVTQASGDQGVDVVAEKEGLKYAVQCKRYSSDLGNAPIQEVVAGKAVYHCHVAAVMTNRGFTSGAKKLASVNGVLLWDRNAIIKMLKESNSSADIV